MRFRNGNTVLYLVLSCVLALGIVAVSAAQTSMPQSSTPQAAPPAQTPPPAQAAPPSSSPQAAPSTPGAQAAPQQGRGTSIDEELQLTPDQKEKIAAVVDDENKQISTVRDDNSMTLEQKQEKVMQIRQAGAPKIKAILTAEQLQKLAAIQQRMREQENAPAQQPAQAPPQR